MSRDVRPSDMIASYAIFIAQTVARDFVSIARPQLGDISTLIVSGGGASNPYLVDRLQAELLRYGEYAVMSSNDFNIPPTALGALSTAIVGALRFAGKPNIETALTGNIVSAGAVALPSVRADAMRHEMSLDDLKSRIDQFRNHGFDHFNAAVSTSEKPGDTQRLKSVDPSAERTDATAPALADAPSGQVSAIVKPASVFIDLSALDDATTDSDH